MNRAPDKTSELRGKEAIQIKITCWPGEMIQPVKCLLCKLGDLSSSPGTNVKKKVGVFECNWNPSPGEVETGRSLRLASQPA